MQLVRHAAVVLPQRVAGDEQRRRGGGRGRLELERPRWDRAQQCTAMAEPGANAALRAACPTLRQIVETPPRRPTPPL